MKNLLAALLILLSGAAQAQWMSSTETLIPMDGSIGLWRFNSWNGHGVIAGAHPTLPVVPENTMTFIDLFPLGVPIDTVAVHLVGILIITHGYVAETCDLQLFIDGVEQIEQPYIGQAVEAHTGSGIRSTFSVIAPVRNGMVGVKWRGVGTYGGQYPAGCAYGANLSIDAVFR